ncbi:MAG: DNA repair protein RadC [Gammaproteobacteria bacterium]|nr:DNA repair protein RadC [Gammaproteobacteria bacterium]
MTSRSKAMTTQRPARQHVQDGSAAVAVPLLRRDVGSPPPPPGEVVASIVPRHEQPRERLLRLGAEALRDAELVALVLRTGDGRRDAVALGERLLECHDGVQGLLRQGPRSLSRTPGVGPTKAAAFVAARELQRRAALEEIHAGPVLSGSVAVRRFLAVHLAHHEREVFGVLLLSARNRLIAVDDLFRGSVDRAAVYPREVVKTCLRHNASGVVLFHNHPSGVPEPSPSDIQLTTRLQSVLEEIDVRVLDHVVVAGMEQVSFAERGLL